MCDAAACIILSEPIAVSHVGHNKIEEVELQGRLFRPISKTPQSAAVLFPVASSHHLALSQPWAITSHEGTNR